MMKSMVRYEEVASDPTAVWRIATAANHKTDMVQHQRGDFQKVMAGIRESLNRIEVLVQRYVSSQTRDLPDLVPPAEWENEKTRRSEDLRLISLNSTQGTQLRNTPEGNFNSPPTGYSVVVTGGGDDLLPQASIATPTLNNMNPSYGPEMAKDMERGVSVVTDKHAQNASVGQNMNLTTVARGKLLNEATTHKKETPHKPFPPGICKYCRGKGFLGHKCKHYQQINVMAGDVSDEAQFDLAQLYVGDTGLFWKLPPWPDFCTMNCDSFAQHCGYEVIENFYSVRKVIPIIPGDYSDLELKSVGTVKVNLGQARDLTNKDVIRKSDPFAILYVPPLSDKTKRSKTINKDLNLIGNEYSESIVEDADTHSVTVKIYDDDGIQGSELVGCVQVVLNDLQKGKVKDVWLKLVQDLEIQRDWKNWGQEHLELLNCPFDMKYEAMNNYGKDYGQISSWVKIRSYEQCKVFFSKISPYSKKKHPVPLDVSSLITFVGNQAPPLEIYNEDLGTLTVAVWIDIPSRSDTPPQKHGSYVLGNLTGQIGKLSFRSQGISQDISVGTDEFMSFKKPTRSVLKVRKPRAVVYIIPAVSSALLMNELQWIGLIVKPIDYSLKDGILHIDADVGLKIEESRMIETENYRSDTEHSGPSDAYITSSSVNDTGRVEKIPIDNGKIKLPDWASDVTTLVWSPIRATHLVLTVTLMLKKQGVVGKFVGFYSEGMGKLSLADRATIAKMSPEYGATREARLMEKGLAVAIDEGRIGPCDDPKAVDQAEMFFNRTSKYGVMEDCLTLTTVVHGYCFSGHLTGVIGILKKMSREDPAPNVVTYNLLMNYLCKYSRCAAARKNFDSMVENGPTSVVQKIPRQRMLFSKMSPYSAMKDSALFNAHSDYNLPLRSYSGMEATMGLSSVSAKYPVCAFVPKERGFSGLMIDSLLGGVFAAVSKTAAASSVHVQLLIQNQSEVIKSGKSFYPNMRYDDCFAHTTKDEGPYQTISRIGTVAYRLALPASSKVHPVFHVSQLKQAVGQVQGVSQVLPDDTSQWSVPEKILQRRSVIHGMTTNLQGLIQWSHMPASLATWEDLLSLRQRFPRAAVWGQTASEDGGM